MTNRIIRIVSAACLPMVTFLLLTGCVERELKTRPSDGPGDVEIALDWSGLSAPRQSARCLFYDESGMLIHEATGLTDGFKSKLPSGKYHLIVHNEDAHQVDYRGTNSYKTAEVFVLPQPDARNRIAPRAADLPCILEPEASYGTSVCEDGEWITVVPGKTTRTTVSPVAHVRQLEFRFVVRNINVRAFNGILTGVASSIFLSTGEANRSEGCALRFAPTIAAKSRKDDTEIFTVSLRVFNLLTTANSPAETNTVVVTLTDVGGTRYETSVDFTATLQEIIAENGGTIPIEIPIEVLLEATVIEGSIVSSVQPWDDTGTGGGGNTWD